jgi:hypothetical protein
VERLNLILSMRLLLVLSCGFRRGLGDGLFIQPCG